MGTRQPSIDAPYLLMARFLAPTAHHRLQPIWCYGTQMRRVVSVALVVAAVALVAAAAYVLLWSRLERVPRPIAVAAPSSSVAAPAPGTLTDPLNPDRPVTLDATARRDAGDWVSARPGFQYSRSAIERGGVEPCATQSIDSSAFEDWVPLSQGHFSAPRGLRLGALDRFDLIIHLNGDEPVRRELIKSQQLFVLYTLTLGPDKSYAPLFSSSYLFDAVIAGVERAVSKQTGKAARVGHIALSAWSAGFVGIEAALGQAKASDIDAVILIDGLHAPRNDRNAFKAQLQPFVDYAARAAAKERFMFVSHSSIDPPNFASTSECAHYLIASLGGKPEPVQRADALGLELVEFFSKGDLHVRGYAGNDKADHCAQLALLRDAYVALGRRWAK